MTDAPEAAPVDPAPGDRPVKAPSPAGTAGCVILGAGGHARVVLDALRAEGCWPRLTFVDRDPALAGQAVDGVTVIGGDEALGEAVARGFTHFIVGVGGVADNRPRQVLFDKGLVAGLKPASAVHPTAVVAASAAIGAGTAVMAGVVVNPGAAVGRNAVLNTRCVVEHDCRIGDHAQVAPGAVVLGGVTVGALAYIGAGAVLRQGVHIGEAAVVGAGAVVLADVPDGARAVGVPAVCTPRR